MSTETVSKRAGNFNDLSGRHIGLLTVVAFAGVTSRRHALWTCKCECGQIVTRNANTLLHGGGKSCGCLRRATTTRRNTTHGMSQSAEYATWARMIRRCSVTSGEDYELYAKRGISVCERWRASFASFFEDMGHKPHWSASIDRIDNNGNYEPGNCRWSTARQQALNRRSNVLVTFNKRTQAISEWAEEFGVSRAVIERRVARGVPINMPIQRSRRRLGNSTPIEEPTP